MQKKIFLYIGVSIIVGIITSLSFLLSDNNENLNSQSLSELEFTYDEANSKLKQNLASDGILMSSPIELSNPNQLEEFCSFFDDANLQKYVEYCTSTELRNSEGVFLGNIHMIGSKIMPKMVLVLIQTDPFMNELDEIKNTSQIVVEDLVCNCWEDVKPGDIPTVSHWIDKQRDFHTSDVKPNSKSILNLSVKNLQMELTTNTQGYLWKLIISG